MSVKFGAPKDDFWKKQVDGIFSVVLGYKHSVETGEDIITWTEGGKYSEEKTVYEDSKGSARDTLKAQFKWAQDHGHIVSLNAAAKALLSGKPTRRDVHVDVWEERDRLSIVVAYKDDHPLFAKKSVAEWRDEDARSMFEDGFFKPWGPMKGKDLNFIDSVLSYCEDMKFLEKEKY